jgi:hypothetical protein
MSPFTIKRGSTARFELATRKPNLSLHESGSSTYVRFSEPRAYIAPLADEPQKYSVFVDQPEGGFELSPELDSLLDAISWALERTDWVIARSTTGPYLWYGRGNVPPDVKAPPSD